MPKKKRKYTRKAARKHDRVSTLARDYINSLDLPKSMEKGGYETDHESVCLMKKSDRFRDALREEFDIRILEVLLDVGKTGRGNTRIKALREAKCLILGESETPSAGGGEKAEDKDERLPDTAW